MDKLDKLTLMLVKESDRTEKLFNKAAKIDNLSRMATLEAYKAGIDQALEFVSAIVKEKQNENNGRH